MGEVRRVHCSYHKCLTVYFGRVLGTLLNRCLPWSGGYHHYNSHLEDFYAGHAAYRVASVNNRCLDLARLGEVRVTRFLRDPRDLVVSGYHYHLRGAEAWVRTQSPSEEDWYFANGVVPAGLKQRGGSLSQYLQSLDEEGGLLAELELRQRHFESMAEWPEADPRVLLFRYEDVLGHEEQVFSEIFRHYGLSLLERSLGRLLVRRYSLRGRGRRDRHVRDPVSGQWRGLFTPRVQEAFEARHPGLVERLGYRW